VASRPAPNSRLPAKIDQRGPTAEVQRPASSDAAIIRAVIGRNASAILYPLYPATSCRYKAVKKNTANVAK
jgi:hypothetical protein